MRIKLYLVFILSVFFISPLSAQKRNANPEGYYAVVAGGSKGIGYAIAEALAKRNYNLVLIARGQEFLSRAKDSFESKYGVKVETLALDLSTEESADSVARFCTDNNLRVNMLFNVAGYGGTRDFPNLSLDTLRYMVRLNVEGVMALTYTMLPMLEANAPSYILNVASMAGFAPIPDKNMYAATKSSVNFFSYALRNQLKVKNISVSCLSPGPVFTKPEIVKDTKEKLGWLGVQMEVPPHRVGEIAVKKTLRGKMMIVPGVLASIGAIMIRILPRKWVVDLYGKVGK